MYVNGYALRAALSEAKLRLDAQAKTFKDSLMAFPDEVKPDPVATEREISKLEWLISEIEVAQLGYNTSVSILLAWPGNAPKTVTLAQAVKLMGPAGRLAKLWREAASPTQDRYSYRETTRDKDAIVAHSTVGRAQAVELNSQRSKSLAALRAAIAAGNAALRDISIATPVADFIEPFVIQPIK